MIRPGTSFSNPIGIKPPANGIGMKPVLLYSI